MPSPFPGMDPYLERPSLWPDVHHELISVSRELLNRRLRPKYAARIESRVYVEGEDDPARKELFVPDIRVAKRPGAPKGRKKAAAGGVAVAEPVPVTFATDLELREARIEVQATDTREVVAVIEFLSPSNKLKGSAGHDSFMEKRREILSSTAHWVEVDFLRAGERLPFREYLADHEYLVGVIPADRRPKGVAWPIRLDQRLPVVGIPLRKPDPDAPLDLQKALTLAYDRAGYDMAVDYAADPAPPLPEEWAGWADELLKARRLR